MKQKFLWLLMGLFIGVFSMIAWTLCSGQLNETEKTLQIAGDVAECTDVKSWSDWTEKESVLCQGESYKGVLLSKVLGKTAVLGDVEQIYMISFDGFTSVIDGKDAAFCYLTYDGKMGWSILAPKHPISTNAKDLKKIVLVSSGEKSKGLTLMKKDGSCLTFSLGQLLTGPMTTYPKFEGEATIETDGKAYSSQVYTKSEGFPLRNLTEVEDTDYLLLETKTGETFFIENRGHFIIEGILIHYVDRKGEIYENIKKVTIHPYVG